MECLIICMMVFLILRQTECLLLFFFNLKKPKGKQVNKQYGSKFNIEIKLEIFLGYISIKKWEVFDTNGLGNSVTYPSQLSHLLARNKPESSKRKMWKVRSIGCFNFLGRGWGWERGINRVFTNGCFIPLIFNMCL